MTRLQQKMIKRRRKGKALSPCRTAPSRIFPTGRALRVSTPWGKPGSMWAAGHHTGEDYAAPIGSQAVAVTWGEVVQVGSTTWGPAYGVVVIIRNKRGRYDYGFCHLSKTLVRVGQKVKPGTVVGLTGNTGNTTGPHLHFEVRPAGGRYGSDVDPMRVKRAS